MTRRGLTGMELMVALAVTGLAALIGTATLALLTDRSAPLREASSATEHAAAVRRTIVAWLEDAHGAQSPFSGNSAAAFELLDLRDHGHGADQLLFTTSAPTPSGSGDTFVRLFVDADPRTPERGLVAELSAWPGAPVIRVPLDSMVTGIDASCLTDLAGSPRWLPTFLSSQAVPRGVELRLRSARPGALAPLLQLPIRVAVEAGR
jgi:type II secretory pathway pseudopilin PulG